jgi:hypothetical protein
MLMIIRHRLTTSRFSSRAFAAVIFVMVFSGLTCAHPSWGIVVSSTGNVYFSDLETVWKLDRAGKLSVFRAGVSGRHVHELSIDDQDNIYGPDFSYEPATQKYITAIWKMAPDGKFAYLQPPSNQAPPGLGILLDRAGNMYSVDQNNHTKTQTLLLKRTPEGVVTTLAGGAFGHADGKGTAAKFSTVGALVFGSDGNLYVSDGEYVRRVSMDGTVVTLAKNLLSRTAEDKPPLFAGSYGSLAGLSAGPGGNVYVADAGDRRLLKIANDGKVTIVYRCDPPYFPTGVFATSSGEVYVLEFSFTPPSTSGGPRVRKITADGNMSLLAEATADRLVATPPGAAPPARVLTSAGLLSSYRRTIFLTLLLSVGIIMILLVWRSRQKHRRI